MDEFPARSTLGPRVDAPEISRVELYPYSDPPVGTGGMIHLGPRSAGEHVRRDTDGDARRGKVERVIEAYGLGDELECARTAADPNQRKSLRDLATRFNERVLEAALQTAGDTVLEGEVEHTYHLLTDDEISSSDRRRAERRLERQRIDIDTLRSDFVSYQAIRTYLKLGTEQGDRRRESA
jgi:hypothetical protein